MVLMQLFEGGKMSISKNLQTARKARGLRQEQLAEMAGVSLTQISKIERDEADPRVSTVEKLAKALECSISKLLFSDEGAGIDELLKRSFERLQRLTPRDKAAMLKVMNMACAGGTVMKSFDEMQSDAEFESERHRIESGHDMGVETFTSNEFDIQQLAMKDDDEYHDRIDRLAEEESKKEKNDQYGNYKDSSHSWD